MTTNEPDLPPLPPKWSDPGYLTREAEQRQPTVRRPGMYMCGTEHQPGQRCQEPEGHDVPDLVRRVHDRVAEQRIPAFPGREPQEWHAHAEHHYSGDCAWCRHDHKIARLYLVQAIIEATDAERWDVTRWAILPPEVPAEVHALHALHADLDQALDVGTGLAQIIGPDQPLDPLTANPDHTWPCADYCCTRGCPGIGNTPHGPPWPCDATRCTCGNTVIRAVAHDRQRLAALVPGLETANHGLHNRNRALRDERDRARRIAVALEQELAQLRSRILDRLRDQGLNIDYLAEPDTREQT